MFKVFAIFILIPIIYAASPMRQCSGGIPLPDAVFFGGRDDPCLNQPCPVFQSRGWGTTYIDFTPNRQITGLHPELWARVIGLFIQHPLPADMVANPFTYLIGPNPIPAGTRVTFNLTIPVPSDVPQVSSWNIFTLYDQNRVPIFCYEIQSVVRP
jgi:ML domain